MQHTVNQILQELESYSDPLKKEHLPHFFKTGKGEYGEGDLFLGVGVPQCRLVAKHHKDVSLKVLSTLLHSPWHECRFCALIILIERFKKGNEADQRCIYDFYLSHTDRINNWDLVDVSAPAIVGEYLLDKPREDLYELVKSDDLWKQRIAIVATLTFIKKGEWTDIVALSEQLLTHPHDLMHKACGWMLREMGKRNKEILVTFLEKHRTIMPRTMLRYAIEKFTPEERAYFMKK